MFKYLVLFLQLLRITPCCVLLRFRNTSKTINLFRQMVRLLGPVTRSSQGPCLRRTAHHRRGKAAVSRVGFKPTTPVSKRSSPTPEHGCCDVWINTQLHKPICLIYSMPIPFHHFRSILVPTICSWKTCRNEEYFDADLYIVILGQFKENSLRCEGVVKQFNFA
jgi:hypothetical protein